MEDRHASDALAFIESLRLLSRGKPGFRWLDEKLAGLHALVGGLVQENERLHAFLDATGQRAAYEAWIASGSGEL